MKKINLRKLRNKANIRAEEVAKYLSTTARTINRWETGEAPISDFYRREYIKFIKENKHEK